MEMDDFGKMNYRDLQKLAKTAGVKANLPKAELLKALRDHAANSSLLTDDEDTPVKEVNTSVKKSRKSEGLLNTTFDKDSDNEKENLNRTFDKDEEEVKQRRSSARLPADRKSSSVGVLSVQQQQHVAKETKNSPAPRRSSNREKLPENVTLTSSTPTSVQVVTPRRVSQIKNEGRAQTPRTSSGGRAQTPRTSGGRKETPRTSGGKIVKLGRKSATPKVLGTPRRSLTSSVKKSTPSRRSGTSSKTSTPAAVTLSGSARKQTPRSEVKRSTPASSKKTLPGTNIPRFVKFARKVPDFTKMHAKQFNKMESLDQYLDKKKKKFENSVEDQRIQRAKVLGDEHQKLMEKMKSRVPFVPSVTSTANINFNFGATAAKSKAAADGSSAQAPGKNSPFKFSAAPATAAQKKPERAQVDVKNATKPAPAGNAKIKKPVKIQRTTVENKKQVQSSTRSAVKAKPTATKAVPEATPNRSVLNKGTPAVKSSSRTPAVNKSTIRTPAVNKSTIRTPATNKSTVETPAVNKSTIRTPGSVALGNITNRTVNCGTPGSTKKAGFDLKASLAKPLGYKPHTGKLPSWGQQKKKITEMRNVTTKDVIERTRNIIKGVRMNKRAALMLQNRNMDE